MKFSYRWLQEYFNDPLPAPEGLVDIITKHAFEVDGVETRGDDHIFDIDILPNRSHDAMSYWGMAREIGALLDVVPNIHEAKATTDANISSAKHITLTVEDPKRVPRAMKRYVESVSVGESPAWLKEKLAVYGQRSINNIVDATNLVMYETGQPVHAFDYEKLTTNNEQQTHITVRFAKKSETVTTLDGKTYELTPEMLIISDDEKALDIAGVKGGAVSGVSNETTRLVLSVCNFEPVNIRTTSKNLGLRTDASVRFENAISPELAAVAMERLSQLVEELAGGKVAHDVVDNYPKDLARTAAPYKIGVSLSEINTLLGTNLSKADVENIFRRLNFSYEIVDPRAKVLEYAQTLVGKSYKYGASVTFDSPNAFDCGSFTNHINVQGGFILPRMAQDQYVYTVRIEEKDALPGDLIFSSTHSDGDKEDVERLGIQQIRKTKQTVDYMPGIQLETSVDHVGIFLGDGKVIHASPQKHKGSVVVEDITESGAFKEVVGYGRIIASDEERFVVDVPFERLDLRAGNGFLVSGIKEDLVEEIGRIVGLENIPSTPLPSVDTTPAVNKHEYYKVIVRDALVKRGFSEAYTYAFQSSGTVELANPLAEDKAYLRASLADGLKDSYELNVKNKPLLGTDTIRMFEIGTVFTKDGEHQEIGIVTEKQKDTDAACVAVDEALGVKLSWKRDGGYASASLTAVLDKLPDPDTYQDTPELPDVVFTPISNYPFALRDIAVWTESDGKEILEEIIKTRGGDLLARMDLFDTFEKDGRTSYAYHLVFQSHEKTLSDDEINEIMSAIEADVKEKGWEVR